MALHGFESHSHQFTGNRSIGGLSALGVGGCEFKSHFLDVKRKYVRISSFIPYDGYI